MKMYKEITQKILDLLQADPTLSGKVKRWHFGFPASVTAYPFIAVRWMGGPVEASTSRKERYEIGFEIAVVDASVKEDEAEKSVMDMVEKVDNVLDGNPTLDGLVDDSRIAEIASETGLARRGGVIVGALVRLTCFKTMV